ncbi:hypothetical protein [Treponema phagedenis]|uniref:hypothetical protein n=2 Tax=Treponema phagedenis TaxID=162 RepID=UPI0011E6089C|nr:hypothetical protein [Treponema phagedenis]NVP23184.1 hypothetical protein [Treponema phagedenis]QEK05736.1 hypothetical protein FUT80_02705 [Treponema phagedenis]QLC58047.1 hypothetical protein HW453_03940 [Treponema phagedenis]
MYVSSFLFISMLYFFFPACASEGKPAPSQSAQDVKIQIPKENTKKEEKIADTAEFVFGNAEIQKELHKVIKNNDLNKAFAIIAKVAAEEKDQNLADKKMRDGLQSIYSFLEKIRMEAVVDKNDGAKPFCLQVSVGADDKKLPLANVEVVVEYPFYTAETLVGEISFILTTDGEGKIFFTLPPNKNESKALVYIKTPIITNEENIVPKNLFYSLAYADAAAPQHGNATTKKRISSTICILDYNKNGTAITYDNLTSTRLLGGLMKRRFTGVGIDTQGNIGKVPDSEVIAAARKKFGGGVRRFMFGLTRVEKLEKGEDGLWLCTLSGKLSVWDFSTEKFTHHFTATYTTKGKTEAQAYSLARTNMGDVVLAEVLNYGL